MDRISFYTVFILALIKTLLLIYMGLGLTDLRPAARSVFLVAFLGTLCNYFIQLLSIPFGLNIFIQLPIIIVLLFWVCKLPWPLSIFSTVLGFLSVSMTEIFFDVVFFQITGISNSKTTSSSINSILLQLPPVFSLGFLVTYLRSRHVNVFYSISNVTYDGTLDKNVYTKPLLILSLPVILVVLGDYYLQQFKQIIAAYHSGGICIFSTIMSIAIILALGLSWKILIMTQQTELLRTQQYHISNLHEMTQIIKGQRHDFVNHLQVIYGLIKLGKTNQVNGYIQRLYQDVQVTSEIIQLSIPELSALLLVQSGWATAHNISLSIEIDANLILLKVPTQELITIVGNLTKNALEAVDKMDSVNRTIKLRIFENPIYYVIQTQNPGYIPANIRNKIFDEGFSTKTSSSERGIGLTSVKYIVEKHYGRIVIYSHLKGGTRFTVCLPKQR